MLVCVDLCRLFPRSYRPKVTTLEHRVRFFSKQCIILFVSFPNLCFFPMWHGIYSGNTSLASFYNFPWQGWTHLLQSPVDGHLVWLLFFLKLNQGHGESLHRHLSGPWGSISLSLSLDAERWRDVFTFPLGLLIPPLGIYLIDTHPWMTCSKSLQQDLKQLECPPRGDQSYNNTRDQITPQKISISCILRLVSQLWKGMEKPGVQLWNYFEDTTFLSGEKAHQGTGQRVKHAVIWLNKGV